MLEGLIFIAFIGDTSCARGLNWTECDFSGTKGGESGEGSCCIPTFVSWGNAEELGGLGKSRGEVAGAGG